jgi:hypothetical protein
MPTLLELQRSFAAGLRDLPCEAGAWAADDGIPAAARLRIYRNNSSAQVERSLNLTFPVVLRRVGADYFRQLAHHFRTACPSRHGDLHEIGRRFPEFLAAHLAGTPYSWLAELAVLEWAVAEAAVSADSPVADPASLAGLTPSQLEDVRFEFVPSLRLVSASVPVLAVWRANQVDGEGQAVDISKGSESVLVHRGSDGVLLRLLGDREHDFLGAIAAGKSLAVALEQSALPLEELPVVLHRLFASQAVAAVRPPPLT